MNNANKIKILVLMMASIQGFGQLDFQPRRLVSMPGENINYQISSNPGFSSDPIFMCWENRNDSTGFSIYRMSIWPDQGEAALIARSSDSLLNPDVSLTGDVVWQERSDNNWGIKYYSETDGTLQTLTDSFANAIQPSLSNHILVYVQDTTLIYRNLYTGDSGVVDRGVISHPDLSPEAYSSYWQVCYEKQRGDSASIFIGDKWHENSDVSIRQVSTERINRNARFGTMGGIVYQSWGEDAWEIKIEDWILPNIVHGTRPALLMVPIPVVREVIDWQVFYEKTGEDGDEDIYASGYSAINEAENISDLPGIDENPHCSLLHMDSVAVFWEHVTLEGREIWWAKDKLHIQGGAVHEEVVSPTHFKINKVYPNPFNNEVNLSYEVETHTEIEISILDIKGMEVHRTRFMRSPGNYVYKWDGSMSASGEYLITFSDGSQTQTRKVILLK